MIDFTNIVAALILSLIALIVYLIYTSKLKHWEKERVLHHVIFENLEEPYNVSGVQEFIYSVSEETHLEFYILNANEDKVASLKEELHSRGEYRLSYDCADLKKGWYWCHIITPKQNITRKFRVV